MTNKAEIAVEKFLAQTDSEAAAFFEACVHCGICADACQFHLATGDPKYTPIYKLRPMERAYKREKAPFSSLKKALGLAPKPVTEAELIEWGPLVYDSCNMCARCTLVCPMGIDIAGTISKMREGYAAAGLAPEGLERSADFVRKTSSPMGVTVKALKAQIKHQEKDSGLKIPVDKHGADYMCTFSSSEIMGYPEVLGAYAKLFDRAGVSWTISSVAYEATNVGVQIGSSELAKEIVTRVVESAEALGVKAVISPECGHAYGAIRFAGPNLMGRQYKFEVVHIIEVIDRLRREGKLPAGKKDDRKMTLHDPCQIVRRGGLLKEPRRLLTDSCSNFTEMKYAGKANFCCGGGGGVSANERAEELRTEAFSLKVEQLNGVEGLEAVVVPCANCRAVFEDGLDAYEMDLEVIGLTELVAQTLAEPDEKQG